MGIKWVWNRAYSCLESYPDKQWHIVELPIDKLTAKWEVSYRGPDVRLKYSNQGYYTCFDDALQHCEVNNITTDEFVGCMNNSVVEDPESRTENLNTGEKACCHSNIKEDVCVGGNYKGFKTTVKFGDFPPMECTKWEVKDWEKVADERGKTIEFLNHKINALKTEAKNWKQECNNWKQDYEVILTQRDYYIKALADLAIDCTKRSK